MLLFNVVLEAIIRCAKLQTTGTIFNTQTQLLAYADNIDIFGRGSEVVRDAYLALEADATKVRMKINEQKTTCMIAARNRTILDAGQTVAFGEKDFEVVNEFVYLGALVTPRNDVGWRYNEGSKLQVGASTACKSICGYLTWHVRQSY
jgi:hypothetical protein